MKSFPHTKCSQDLTGPPEVYTLLLRAAGMLNEGVPRCSTGEYIKCTVAAVTSDVQTTEFKEEPNQGEYFTRKVLIHVQYVLEEARAAYAGEV